MKKVNISNDVESRIRIAQAVPVMKVIGNTEKQTTLNDGKSTEVQRNEDNAECKQEPSSTPKRGRKAARDVQKI